MKSTYNITKETIEKVLDVLSDYYFSEGGEHNNIDIIEAEEDLRFEINNQKSQ